MKLIRTTVISLVLIANNSFAAFSSPKILNQSAEFYYHQITPNKNTSLPTTQDNPNPVFILGGGPGFSSWNLEPIQQNLANLGYPTYLMDMLGIGENKTTRPGKTLQAWIRQVHQLKTEVAPHSQVTLVAHSWGALMAMLYTRYHSEDVAKIILLNPVDPQKKAMENLTDDIHNRNQQETEIEWDNDLAWENNTTIKQADIQKITLRQIQQVLPTYFLNYALGKEYAKQFTVNDFNIDLNIQAWKEYETQPILYSEIESWQKPIYFLECKQDYLMPYNLMAMQKNMTFKTVDIIEQCGHFPWIEQPKVFYDFLGRYLNE